MLDASIVSFFVDKIQSLPSGLVYTVVALLVFGEAALFIGFVLPGETSVIVAGVVASQGRVNIVALCVLVVVAAIIGDSVGYFVGQRWGSRILEMKMLQRRREDVDRAIEGLRKRGPFYVFLGRFTAFLRAVMPGLAGLSRMKYQVPRRQRVRRRRLGCCLFVTRLLRGHRVDQDRTVRELVRHCDPRRLGRGHRHHLLPAPTP